MDGYFCRKTWILRKKSTAMKSDWSILKNAKLISNEILLTHLSLTSLLWDIGKQNSPRCEAAERGVPSGAILFAERIFIEKLNKI